MFMALALSVGATACYREMLVLIGSAFAAGRMRGSLSSEILLDHFPDFSPMSVQQHRSRGIRGHANRVCETMIEFLGRAFAPVAAILSFIAPIETRRIQSGDDWITEAV